MVAMKMLKLALVAAAFGSALGACSAPTVDKEAAWRKAMARGVAALEADLSAEAVTAFSTAADLKAASCEPQLGLTLAHTLGLVRQIRDFNALLFQGRAPDPDDLDVQADDGGLIDTLIVAPLLAPALESLGGMASAADRITEEGCELDVRLPVKAAFGSTVNVNLRLGTRWTEREAWLLGAAAGALLGLDHVLLAHDLEVPSLTAFGLLEKLDRRDPVSFARRLGMVPGSAPSFLDWHADPERRALFDDVPEIYARALLALERVAVAAEAYLTSMPEWSEEEILWIRDFDESGNMTTGDTLMLNVEGKIAVGSDGIRGLDGLEFTVGPSVRPDLLDRTIDFLRMSRTVFAGEATPGTRLKLESLNGFFEIFGQARPFEDVLEIDPLSFFRGAPVAARWIRRDLNGNCSDAEGEEAICACIPRERSSTPRRASPSSSTCRRTSSSCRTAAQSPCRPKRVCGNKSSPFRHPIPTRRPRVRFAQCCLTGIAIPGFPSRSMSSASKARRACICLRESACRRGFPTVTSTTFCSAKSRPTSARSTCGCPPTA